MTRAHRHLESVSSAVGPPRSAVLRILIDQRLVDCVSAGDEVQTLLELCGEAIAREAAAAIGERLLTALDSTEFENEVRRGPDMASLRLRRLAALRVRINSSPLSDDLRARAAVILRRIDEMIHVDATLIGADEPDVFAAAGQAKAGWARAG